MSTKRKREDVESSDGNLKNAAITFLEEATNAVKELPETDLAKRLVDFWKVLKQFLESPEAEITRAEEKENRAPKITATTQEELNSFVTSNEQQEQKTAPKQKIKFVGKATTASRTHTFK